MKVIPLYNVSENKDPHNWIMLIRAIPALVDQMLVAYKEMVLAVVNVYHNISETLMKVVVPNASWTLIVPVIWLVKI